MESEYLSLREAADQYGYSYDRLRRAVYDGRLLAKRTDNRFYIRPEEMDRYRREGGKAPRIEPLPRRNDPAAAKVIAVAIPKGGTGKTTTTLNLGVALHELGQRVLVVDADPQANLTLALGIDSTRLPRSLQTAIERYVGDFTATLDEAIVRTDEGIDLVPASSDLNMANQLLPTALDPQKVLRKLLRPLRSRYDYILIDTLPYLGVLVQNALAAADEVLVPLQAQWLASDSVRMMVMEVRNFVKSEVNPDLRLAGFLFTQVEPQATVQRDQMAYVRRQYGEDAHIFDTMIEARLSVQESQSPAVRQSMFRYKPTDPVTYAYRALAQELLNGAA